MMKEDIILRPGRPEDAAEIAELIMMAMTDDCCLHFCGEGHGLEDFREVMTELAGRPGTQYSYENSICAIAPDGAVAGVCVSYDGADLVRLREPFIEAARERLGRDWSALEHETSAGELYADSLAVKPEWRGRGIARRLLSATIEKARSMNAGPVGLLVDVSNPNAERLYLSLGFVTVETGSWGGHEMKHMLLLE